MKTVTVIQARMGSSRLPGKIMLPLVGQPLLVRQLERVRAAERCGTIVVATTTKPEDDAIAELCRWHHVHCFRGHATDLLDRHYWAGRAFRADVVVKIPSDCPLIDPNVIDRVISAYLLSETAPDFVSNLHPATYPDGNDVEVMSMPALKTAWREAKHDYEREHTTPFFWDNPGRFRIHNVAWETGLNYAMSHRWTIDYPQDYEFIRAVYAELFLNSPHFTLWDILRLLERNPQLSEINAHLAGVNWYRRHLRQLRTIDSSQTRMLAEIDQQI